VSKQNLLGNGITVAVIVFGIALTAGLFSMVGDSGADKSIDPLVQSDSKAPEPTSKIAPPMLPPGQAIVGGVQRPASDVRLGGVSNTNSPKERRKKPHGFSPPVKPETNEQTKLVAQSLAAKDKPQRYSSFVTPYDFDKAAFEADPKSYAAIYASDVAPGRVFASAQPGENVTPIKATSSRLHRVKQGESVRLSVKAIPFAPVTFSSHDLGSFDNQLTTATVVADEQGLANANFTASGGTIDQVYVLAASPVTSGQAKFTIDISLPKQ
jgi:hypothetical protein